MAEGPAGTATVLFTDVVGSTALRTRLGDPATDDLMRHHEHVLADAVTGNGGSLVKGLGDGILATFGGAADAVLAAIAIQRVVLRANRRAADDRRFEVRVGISAGDITWAEGDCHGTPVVTASRLCNAADGGQIVCDDLVRGLARGRADLAFSVLGELTLKGLAEAVMAYEVGWEGPRREETVPLPAALRSIPGELPFAGRDAERRRLGDAWKQAQADGATVALVSGEPGVGKTRLASELARAVHHDGGLVLLGRCDEHVSGTLAPWIEALRTLIAYCDESLLREHVSRRGGELGRIVPELANRIDELPAPQSADAETERFLLFDAVIDLLSAVAPEQPLMFVLDDAHWADAGSVQLLRHACAHFAPETPILVVVTYRDTDIDRSHALSGALADLRRAPRVERIDLHGLDEQGMQALLVAAGGHDLEDDGIAFARRLVEETEGNPFFVTEVIRHLVETDTLVQRDGRWVGVTTVEEMGLPEGVRDVVGRRLSRVSDDANDALRIAAVVGREFDVGVVATVADCSEDDMVDRLDEALAARLVDEVADRPSRLTFSHALVRSTLIDELSTNRRVRLHKRIGEALEGRGAPVAELAHHFCEAATAGGAERAVRYACEAGLLAQRQVAFDDAVRLFARALDALDALETEGPEADLLRAGVLSQFAMAEHDCGNDDHGRALALEAAALARRHGDAVQLAEAGRAYQGTLGMWARPSESIAIDVMREALDLLGDTEPEIRARAKAGIAYGLILAPGEEGLRAADEAVALATETGDPDATKVALLARAWSVWGTRPVAERLSAGEALFAAAERIGDRNYSQSGEWHIGNALLCTGELEAAGALLARSMRRGGALAGWIDVTLRAARAFAEGQYAEGDVLADEAYRLGADLGDTNDGLWGRQVQVAQLERGNVAAARANYDLVGRSPITATGPEPTLLSAAEGAPTSEVRELVVRWVRDIMPLLPGLLALAASDRVAILIEQTGAVDVALPLWDYLEPFSGELNANATWIGYAVDHSLGLLATTLERLDDAVDLLTAGHGVHVQRGLHARSAQSAFDLGRVRARRGAPGDREASEALVAAAADLAERIGRIPLAQEARALLG